MPLVLLLSDLLNYESTTFHRTLIILLSSLLLNKRLQERFKFKDNEIPLKVNW
jgi:hypothetical protein